MKHKEATRRRADGRVELTGAVDERGILVELDAHDIERLPREEIDRYRERRAQQIEGALEEGREAADLERFTAAFVANGGKQAEASAAFRAHRARQAAEAASAADGEAARHTRRLMRGAL